MRTFKIWGLVGILMLAILIALVSCGPRPQNQEDVVQANVGYTIEEITPEILVVVGQVSNESSRDGERRYGYWGYGVVLRQGLQEIGKRYIIESVTPIDYTFGHPNSGYGSVTKELIVKVKPRQ